MNSLASPSVNEISQEPTAGPWSYRLSRHSTAFVIVDQEQRIVGDMSWHSTSRAHYPFRDESEANARLIAAAPDLLDAAKLGLSIAKSWIDQEMTGTAHAEAMRALKPIRAAIARASGEKT